MSALEKVGTFSATGSASLTISNCFTDTYDVYKIIVKELDTTASAQNLDIRLCDNTGTVITTSAYNYVRQVQESTRTYLQQNGSSNANVPLINIDGGSSHNPAIVIEIFQTRSSSFYTQAVYESNTYNIDPNAYYLEGVFGNFQLNQTVVNNGIEFSVASGTMDITVSVFGYLDS